MKGKLSWMVISIIGGTIVVVGIIFFFSFFGNAVIESLIGGQAVKSWIQMGAGIQKAYTTGGSVLPGWSLDWIDCRYISSAYYGVNSLCAYGGNFKNPPNYYKKTKIERMNVILFLNKTTYNDIRAKKMDSQSLNVLHRCSGKGYCLCLASVESKNFDTTSHFRIAKGDKSDWKRCAWGTSSFITYSKEDDLISTIDKLKFIQCQKIQLPVKIKVGDTYEDLFAIQHFEGIIYLTREKSTNGYFIHLKFEPKEPYDGNKIPRGGCAFVDNKVYFG